MTGPAPAMPANVPQYPGLEGRVAVVTGGSKGIGAATCRALVANGVRVAVNGRDAAGIDALVQELESAGGEAIGVPADVRSANAIEAMRADVESGLGPPDFVLAFAGGFDHFTPVVETSEDEWEDVLRWNLTSTFLTVKTFLPAMLDRGSGAIVTMASNAARVLDGTLTASYAAAKAAVVQFTRHVALEVAPAGVRINCVAPATSLTERVERNLGPSQQAALAAKSPLGRLGLPEDSAFAALYLISDAAGWLTGVTLDVAGGRVML